MADEILISNYNPPKGMRDIDTIRLELLKTVINQIESIFQLYGGLSLDTPILENMGLVKKMYGDEFNKLVYKLDGESSKLLLRYDLTLSFARFIINNSLSEYKRYTIGKVYRRDNPKVSKGRYREFWQCDFDIAGNNNDNGLQEIEILNLICEVLNTIMSLNYVIRINDKSMLFNILLNCGFSNDELSNVCNIIDKIDWNSIDINDICTKYDLDPFSLGKLINIFNDVKQLTSNRDILAYLKNGNYMSANIYNYMCKLLDIPNVVFDLTLARGLDYYTGLIYEVSVDNNLISTSIAAGGRYDNLVKSIGGADTSVIGVSFGLDRILDVLIKKGIAPSLNNAQVYIASVGKGMDDERMKLCLELRNLGLYTETNYWINPKMKPQINQVLNKGIKYMIIIGENEIKNNMVQFKIISEKRQIQLERNAIYQFIKNMN